jgi:flagellar motor switch protein FliG
VTDRTTLQKQLIQLVETRPATQIQNRLMACPDRRLAIALLGMDEDAIDRIISVVSETKARRVREELSMQAVRGLDPRIRLETLRDVVAALRSDSAVQDRRSYLRPRHGRNV